MGNGYVPGKHECSGFYLAPQTEPVTELLGSRAGSWASETENVAVLWGMVGFAEVLINNRKTSAQQKSTLRNTAEILQPKGNKNDEQEILSVNMGKHQKAILISCC